MSATCNCCSGVHVETPRVVTNRRGLSAIAYRVGDWASFRNSMRASLTGNTPINALTTREDDDFTIALLDAWAVSADVLTFYQERIANESYLRTAGERMSVLELARLIGYELAPGVAAEVWLAFNVDTAAGAPPMVNVVAGSPVQSVPGQDEEPQTFETTTALLARAVWNDLTAATFAMRNSKTGETEAYFKGTDTNLGIGDGLLFTEGVKLEHRRLLTATPDFKGDRTRVTWAGGLAGDATKVEVTRVRASLFGHNAPRKIIKVDPFDETEWPFSITNTLFLDGIHEGILPGAKIVVTAPGVADAIHTVSAVVQTTTSAFRISGKTTIVALKDVALNTPADLSAFNSSYRSVTVYAAPTDIDSAGYPLPSNLDGNEIRINELIFPMVKRPVIITGRVNNMLVSEPAVVASVDGFNVLNLAQPLQHTYARNTVHILGNITTATHGETVREVLGNGNASVPFQRFRLSHAPLTHLQDPAATGGAASTLQVFVNDVRWQQVATLYGAGPHARIYTARLDDDGKTTVNFGDGKTTGARLPTGSNNVRAIYRKTMGTPGNVAAGKITSLLSRPLGLAGVTNPLPSSGGVDRQQLADARGNAPHTVLTLDRVVSLRDYESFAMRFTGIEKAVATWTWSGTERQVFLTVAGPAGITVDDATLTSLTRAIILHGRPYVPLRVVSYVPVLFKLKAKLVIERDLVPDIVLPRVRDAVKTAFAFEARNFGEAVDLSDIVKVIHGAGGVVSVDVDALHRSADPEVRSERLVAKLPRQDNLGNLIPAEILILDTADIREAQ